MISGVALVQRELQGMVWPEGDATASRRQMLSQRCQLGTEALAEAASLNLKKNHIIPICIHPLTLWGFPAGSVVKNPPANAGDIASIPESGRSPGEGNDNPLQCSCLENPMDRGAWWATVHGVEKELVMTYQLNNNNIKGNFLDMLKSI